MDAPPKNKETYNDTLQTRFLWDLLLHLSTSMDTETCGFQGRVQTEKMVIYGKQSTHIISYITW